MLPLARAAWDVAVSWQVPSPDDRVEFQAEVITSGVLARSGSSALAAAGIGPSQVPAAVDFRAAVLAATVDGFVPVAAGFRCRLPVVLRH